MTTPVNGDPAPRAYRSTVRSQRAAATRSAVLRAARELFTGQGYAATTVTDVARRAGVAVDTVYAAVGRKPELARAVVDMVLASGDEPLPAEQRDYVRRIRSTPGARAKLAVYAEALGHLLPVFAPLQEALREAAATDPGCATAWRGLVERRAANMLLLAHDLRATGELRDDLDDRTVADIVWATNSAEYYGLLRQRGWDDAAVAAHLVDLWSRVLLRWP
ncbi:TetR/AcrR family transcriptional regulator [Jannaschia sp. R86511]|uniref:TetR/AcrR family transcriptional regulator n=1 Tax=Jannaschia sp. R86511 TaxID=3093853 RepID=UPI0036D3793C